MPVDHADKEAEELAIDAVAENTALPPLPLLLPVLLLLGGAAKDACVSADTDRAAGNNGGAVESDRSERSRRCRIARALPSLWRLMLSRPVAESRRICIGSLRRSCA